MKEYLEKRIAELYAVDAEFCKKRWDKGEPEYVRKLNREMSNQVTFARQELQEALKHI
jgi:DNA polymerase III sliding clamp (beta) subunit (PCNA family)